jgi:hypothetical protein
MTEQEYQHEKEKLLGQSKNKGLDLWKKVLKHYGISLKRAQKGVYIEGKGYMVLYFDKEKDQWLMKQACPKMN